jgi:regulator of ribosome biosynthesis
MTGVEKKDNSNATYNVNFDIGHLLINDTKTFNKNEINEDDILSRGKENVVSFFQELFKIAKTQKGEEEENRDFDKAADSVKLPKPETLLPRSKRIPKPKPLTKWERFRKEKGLEKNKRSRMVYSELAKDWVPRWGKGR